MLSGQDRPAERQQDGKAEPVGREPSHPHAGKRELDGFRQGGKEGCAAWITQRDVPGRIVGDIESGRGKAFTTISAPCQGEGTYLSQHWSELEAGSAPLLHTRGVQLQSRRGAAAGHHWRKAADALGG